MSRGQLQGSSPRSRVPDYGPNFESIRKNFLIAAASFLALDSAMSAGKPQPRITAEWYVQGIMSGVSDTVCARRSSSLNDRRANSLALDHHHIAPVCAVRLRPPGRRPRHYHPAVAPPPRPGDGTNNRGDIVYTMPDGTFCQHMTFDNTTGQISAGGIDRCDPSIGDGAPLDRSSAALQMGRALTRHARAYPRRAQPESRQRSRGTVVRPLITLFAWPVARSRPAPPQRDSNSEATHGDVFA